MTDIDYNISTKKVVYDKWKYYKYYKKNGLNDLEHGQMNNSIYLYQWQNVV